MAEVVVGTLVSTLLSEALSPEPPKLSTPTKAPEPDAGAIQMAKRKKLTEMTQRGGRASTILTEGGLGSTLGG